MFSGRITHHPRASFSPGAYWRRVLPAFGLVCALIFGHGNAQTETPQTETPPASDAAAVQQTKDALTAKGIEPTPEGVKAYLRALHPSPEMTRRLQQLITELGDPDFFKREAAMTALLQFPVRSPQLFDEAITKGDAEIRWRARQVLKLGNHRTEETLYSVFKVVRAEQFAGLTLPVLEALPYCAELYVREEALRALKAIATRAEAPLLRKALGHSHPAVQAGAIVILEAVAGAEAQADLIPFLADKNAQLRLTASRALANQGNRQVLPVLVELLAAEDVQLRTESATTLRQLTGRQFGFVAYDAEPRQTAARDQWKTWLLDHGATATLTFPLPDGPVYRGHTLLCNYTTKKVIELDANHREVWSTTLDSAWSCQGLPNGHRLVTSYSGKFIIEYDLAGHEIWKQDSLKGFPYSVERLPNGNTLVACSDSHVYEFAPDGKIVWQVQLLGTLRDAERLENGHTLAVLYTSQQIVEVDRAGNVVWQLKDVQRPISAQQLPNGNVLVCHVAGRRLVELDRKGVELWSKNFTSTIYNAQRLTNGNTLVVGPQGATEYDPQGETVWQFQQAGLRGIHRF